MPLSSGVVEYVYDMVTYTGILFGAQGAAVNINVNCDGTVHVACAKGGVLVRAPLENTRGLCG